MSEELERRRAQAQAGRDMLARSIAAGHRAPPKKRLTPREFADHAFAELVSHSRALGEQRRGKRRRLSEVQNANLGRRSSAVSLPKLSILEGDP